MKKRDFLFLGLILAAVPVGAQRPAATPQDAKVIFTQTFEPKDESMTADEAWEAWQAEVIDTIKELKFYNKASAGNINPSADINIYDGSEDWKIGYIRTDSISADAQPGEGILLKNGVVITDANVADWPEDVAKIVTDETSERAQAFDKYGEDGGKYVFRYISGKPTLASSQYGEYYENVSAAYRRNLFVRGLDIEDNTSYRVTFFIKGRAQGTTKPKFYLNMMRGYFNSECDFSMGYVDNNKDNHPLEYSTAFSLTKEDFTGEWEKVTFMTHYLTDSISNAYIFTKNGYWWSGRWWATDAEGKTYDYIQQPDKFFLRLSFASDSTTFDVDNIAITKSTIGGVEHDGTMIRVNFGYDTNLKTLADNAYKATGVAAIELPGQYFSVFGKAKANGRWVPIEINSAEYHDDGYMYMWSKDTQGAGGTIYQNPFTSYDSVFVSFTNPVDDDAICLKYSGDRFPYALDTTWIKEGKKLRGFSNELSVPNPNIIRNQYGKRVYSMKMLPPVLVDQQYEKNSFQLDGSITSMDFKFSRPVMFDEVPSTTTEEALLKVTKGGVTEFWFASSATGQADSTITFTRQQADITKNGALSGDYTFELCGIQGIGTDYAENEIIDYSFGNTIMATDVASIDFSSLDESAGYTQNLSELGIEGLSGDRCAAKIKSFTGTYTTGIMWGLYGQNTGAENKEATCCKLIYTFTAPADGKYAVAFDMTGCSKSSWNDDANMVVFLRDADGNELAKESYGGTGFKPAEGGEVNEVKSYTISANLKAGENKLVITLPNEGSWGGGHQGGKILFGLSIQSNFTNGYPYVKSLNAAMAGLNSKIEFAEDDEDRYTGAAYDNAVAVAEFYEDFTDTKPSRYNTVTDSLSKAASTLQARFDLVAALDKEYDRAIDTIASFEDDDERADFTDMVVFDELYDLVYEVEELIYSDMTDDSIKGVTKMVQDALTAIDNRMKLIGTFNSQLAATEKSIDDAKFDGIQQYADMVEVYNNYKDFDLVGSTDDEITAATKAVLDGTMPYDSYVAGVESSTVGLKALVELADELEVVVYEDEDLEAALKARVEATISDDQDLAAIYKQAIKIALYQMIADGDFKENDEIDLTGFIRNFNLYGAAILDEDVEHYNYQWGTPHDRWRLIAKHESTTAFPGWTTTAAGGNVHVGSEAIDWNSPKAPVYEAYIGSDWSSAVTIKQTLADLPAGLYQLGAGFNFDQDAGKDKSKLYAINDTVTYQNVITYSSKSDQVPEAANQFVDSIKVADGDVVVIGAEIASYNSWTRVDNFELKFIGKDADFNYAAAIDAEKAKLATLLTFVEAAGQDASVSYYGIDGVPVAAPKAGAITIKVTDLGGGKLQVEKILVK
jgi:hypothetical protein